MSNLTDFFSAGGSGSSGIGKTVTVGDYSYPGAIDISDCELYRLYSTSTSSTLDYENAKILTTNHPDAYSGWDNSTGFNTVVDITSSTNGGALYGAISYKHTTGTANDHLNRQVQIRITLDGTATTFTSYQFDSDGREWVWIGGIGRQEIHFKDHDSGAGTFRFEAEEGVTTSTSIPNSWTWDSTTSSFYKAFSSSSSEKSYMIFPHAQTFNKGCRYLHFENTCKVEVKTGHASYGNSTRAYIRLF